MKSIREDWHPSGQWVKFNYDCTYSHSHDGIDLILSKYHATCRPEWLDIHNPVWFSDWSGSIIIQNTLRFIAPDLIDEKLKLDQVGDGMVPSGIKPLPYPMLIHTCYSVSMGQCKKDITPLLTQWNYVFLALTHRYGIVGWQYIDDWSIFSDCHHAKPDVSSSSGASRSATGGNHPTDLWFTWISAASGKWCLWSHRHSSNNLSWTTEKHQRQSQSGTSQDWEDQRKQ